MTVTIKKTNLTHVYNVTHSVIMDTAEENGIRPIELRVLMCIVDQDGESGTGVTSAEIEEQTGITGSNVRHALYELDNAGYIVFLQRERFKRLIATQSAGGFAVAQDCRRKWEEAVTA